MSRAAEKASLISRLRSLEDPTLTDEVKVGLLTNFWQYIADDSIKALIYENPELKVLEILMRFVVNGTPNQIAYALNCFWYLSRASKLFLLDNDIGLVQKLLDFINGNPTARETSIKILSNCSIDPKAHAFLFDPKYDPSFASTAKLELIRNENNRYSFQIWHCIATGIQEHYIPILIEHDIHRLVLNKIYSVGNNLSDWPSRASGPEYYGLNCLVNLSYSNYACLKLRECLNIDFFLPFLTRNREMEQIKVLCILANVYGKSSSSTSFNSSSSVTSRNDDIDCPALIPELSNIFVEQPDILPFLTDILEVTAAQNATISARYRLDGTFFHFGMVRLRSLMKMLRNLSYSQSNCKQMFLYRQSISTGERSSSTAPSFVERLFPFLSRYLEDLPELFTRGPISIEYGGGGQEDEGSILCILEFFIQFMFSISTTKERIDYFQKNEQIHDPADIYNGRPIHNYTYEMQRQINRCKHNESLIFIPFDLKENLLLLKQSILSSSRIVQSPEMITYVNLLLNLLEVDDNQELQKPL